MEVAGEIFIAAFKGMPDDNLFDAYHISDF
jgi:hypothetical protein